MCYYLEQWSNWLLHSCCPQIKLMVCITNFIFKQMVQRDQAYHSFPDTRRARPLRGRSQSLPTVDGSIRASLSRVRNTTRRPTRSYRTLSDVALRVSSKPWNISILLCTRLHPGSHSRESINLLLCGRNVLNSSNKQTIRIVAIKQ